MAKRKISRRIPNQALICDFCGVPLALLSGANRSTRKKYDWYIERSPGWKAVRYWALERAGYKCQKCGAASVFCAGGIGGVVLHVHHLNYDHLGHEWPEDLVVLCEQCHKAEHEAMAKEKTSPEVKP
jgi:5-methylcytosine-specific restriction endonuclease McrA